MKNFNYYTPTEIVFGNDSESKIGYLVRRYEGTKVLIHYGGKSAERSGLLNDICRQLDAEGILYVKLGGVVPNPRLSKVYEGIELCRKEGVNHILAIGGGSVIDSAKAIAYGLAYDGDVWDLFDGKAEAKACYPIGVVLTIPAAGSEMSNGCVITNEVGSRKRAYNNDLARPKFAIMNPERTFSLSTYQTACGIVDIMMHTMERYFTNVTDVQLIDRISEGLLVTVKEEALKIIHDPQNYEVRANLMWAGSLSHNGLTGTGRIGDFATHKIGHELSAMFDATHGASLTAVWSSWAKYVYKTNIERFAQFAVNVFAIEPNYYNLEETALKGIEAWDQWCHQIGMPTTLKELNIIPTHEQIEEMAEKAADTGHGVIGGFMQLKKDDIIQIYQMAL